MCDVSIGLLGAVCGTSTHFDLSDIVCRFLVLLVTDFSYRLNSVVIALRSLRIGRGFNVLRVGGDNGSRSTVGPKIHLVTQVQESFKVTTEENGILVVYNLWEL